MLLKDREAGKRLEALHSTLSTISSADAMGMYYKETRTDHSSHLGQASEASQNVLASRHQDNAEIVANSSESAETSKACCAGGSCGDSRACSTQEVDGHLITAGHTDERSPSSRTSNFTGSDGQVGPSAEDLKKLEDSTTSQLLSMALGLRGPSTLIVASSVLSVGLDHYQRDVSAQFENSSIKLSCFPQSRTTMPVPGSN
jgi:hypothetical protein